MVIFEIHHHKNATIFFYFIIIFNNKIKNLEKIIKNYLSLRRKLFYDDI
jgi:hypothetical protein